MDETRGVRLRLPRSRRLCLDVLHYHRQVPTCAHDRLCDVSRLAGLRTRLPRRISWTLLFLKAFGLVAARRPVLRQTFLRWPWRHVYQHPHTVAMLATERQFRGEPWLFWSRFASPECRPLEQLQASLERYQHQPVERVFRRQLQLSLLPTPLRRLFWWWTLNVSGDKRARRTGTMFLTTLAAQGAEIQHPPAFLTANMTYGPLDDAGRSRVTIAYDHRLMDGSTVAACLAELEATLNGPIAAELEEIIGSQRATAGRISTPSECKSGWQCQPEV